MCSGHRNKNRNSPPSHVSSKGGQPEWSGGGRNGGNAPPTRVSSEGGEKGVVVGVVKDLNHK
jgi:hypothetical protein